MPPQSKGKAKQPKITTALVRSPNPKKKAKRISSSSDDESVNADNDNDDGVDVTPERRGPGRPRKVPEVIEKPPLFSVDYEPVCFSLCVEKKGEHLPIVWFVSVADWLDVLSNQHDTSTEIGPKGGHLHLQSWFEANSLGDEKAINEMKKEIKLACGCRWGDRSGIAVYLSKFGITQNKQRMTGYVRKDRLLTTFRNRNKGISDAMIAAGIEEHTQLKMSFTDGKIIITKANLFNKVWIKWINEKAPTPVLFSSMLCELLNDGKHMLAATLLMNSNGQMRRSAAEVYWAMLMGQEINEYEVQHMIYMPKNSFAGPEYVPGDMPRRTAGLFGDDDDDDDAHEAEHAEAEEDGEENGEAGPP